ncbi:MAG: hypothetical protein AAFX00_05115 [Pseudomonadota bacterium]
MCKGLLATLTFVDGPIVGAIGGGMMGVGTRAGVGIATGLSAGVCGIAHAAQAEGLPTEEEVGWAFERAVGSLNELAPGAGSSGEAIVGAAGDCDDV